MTFRRTLKVYAATFTGFPPKPSVVSDFPALRRWLCVKGSERARSVEETVSRLLKQVVNGRRHKNTGGVAHSHPP